MKIKRLLAMLLSLAMVLAMFPTVALASETDIKFDIVLMQGEQAERKGVGLDFKIQTGSIKINTANVVFTYDTSVFELVDSDGTTLEFPTVSPYELKAAQLSTNSAFDDENKTLVRENTNQTAQVAMLRNAKEEVAFETLTSVGSYFLAYKEGKSITDVTVDSLRLATYDEATRLSQTDVIYVCDEDYNEFEYGTNGGNDDTENWASNISFGKEFEFAKPALTGTPTISGTAKVGETLTADVSALNDSTNLTYQWYADGTAIADAIGVSYTLTANEAGKPITVKVTATADSEYAGTVESAATLVVANASQTAPTISESDITEKTDSSITVTQNAGWEYSKDGGKNWQNSNVFTGLVPNTSYSICVRLRAKTGYDASAASNIVTATTMKALMDDDAKGTLAGYVGTYDGNAHAAVVGTPADGYTIAGYSTTSADSGFSSTMPQITNVADSKSVWVKLSRNGYEDKVFKLKASISPKMLENEIIKLDATQDTYDGNPHTVKFTVKDGNSILGADDYKTVSGSSARNVESTALTIEGKGNYTGRATATWKLTAKYVETSMIGEIADQTYTGNKILPEVSVTGLTEEKDYTVSYSDNTYVGEQAKVTIHGKGNYQGTADRTFKITPAEQTPIIIGTATLTKGGNTLDLGTLVSGAEGTVSFSIASGSAATLDGAILTSTNETGIVQINMSIAEKDENDDGTPEYGAYTATNAIEVTVTDKTAAVLPGGVTQTGCTYGETLVDPVYTEPEDATTTVAYTGTLTKDSSEYSSTVKPTEAGTYTVTVKCETATHIYEATSESFTIAQKSISGMAVTLSQKTTEFSGSTQSVNVISVGTLAASDYDVSGKTSGTNAKVYTVIVTGKGNYSGVTTAQWTITPKEITISGATAVTRSYASNNKDVEISGVTFNGAVLTKDADYTATGKMDDADAGNKTVHVTVSLKNSNYALPSNSFDTTVLIEQADARTLDDVLINQKYSVMTEQSKLLGDLMPADAGTLKYGKGTESKTGAVTVGSWNVDETGKVTFTLIGGATGDTVTLPVEIESTNYKKSTVNVIIALTAKDAQSELVLTGNQSVIYGNTLTLSTSGGSGSGTVSYTVTNDTGEATIDGAVLTPTRAGTVTVTATKAADADYEAISSAAVTITIEKATPSGTPSYTLIDTNGKTLANAALSVGTITPEGTISWVADDGVTPLDDETQVTANTYYNWRFTPTEEANYEPLTGSVKLWSVSTDRPTNNEPVTRPVSPTKPIQKPSEPENPFRDVWEDDYFFEAVQWAVENGITSGTSATTFEPNKACTRAEMVTFLWRAAGKPEPISSNNPFVDVSKTDYFYKAVLWAVENGITKGTSATTFSPNDTCTRAQAVTFLCRMLHGAAADITPVFHDVPVTAYYADAVAWAVENRITNGIGNELFGSEQICTRAQIVTFLYRALG